MGATATVVGTDIILFGGSDGKVGAQKSVYFASPGGLHFEAFIPSVYSQSSLRDLQVLVYVTWLTPQWLGRVPQPRIGHTFTTVGARLFMLGGAYAGQPTNDLYILEPASQVVVPRVLLPHHDAQLPRILKSSALLSSGMNEFQN